MASLTAGSRPGYRRSPSRPRWPWTPRRRRSRPQAARSSASAPASRTSRPRTTSSRRRRARLRRPAVPQVHPARRAARAARGGRGQDGPRQRPARSQPGQVLITNGGKQAVYQTFATLLDPGDEVLMPTPYWTTYPESIALAGGVAGPGPDRRAHRLPGVGGPAGGQPHRADQGAAVRLAVQPDRGGLPARAGRRDRPLGRGRAGSGSSPTRSTSTWSTATPGSCRCRWSCPEIADRCVVLNGVAKTYAMTGWRVGWMIGPADVIKAATNLQSHATSNVCNVAQAAALAAVSGDLAAVDADAGGVRPAPAAHDGDAERDPGRGLPAARGRVLLLPLGQGRARPGDRRAAAGHQRRAGRAGAGRGRRGGGAG